MDGVGLGFGLLAIFYIGIIVLMVAAQWKIYVKAGEEGWASLIPIYNLIVMLRIIRRPPNWIIRYLVVIGVIILGGVFLGLESFLIGGLLYGVGIIGIIVLSIMDVNKLSLAFGKDSGFTVGLIFLPFIFYPILGFGDAQYVYGMENEDDKWLV